MYPSCVCRLWRDCARRKLKTRQRIAWISSVESSKDLPRVDAHSLISTVKRELENVYVIPQTFLYVTDYHTLCRFGEYNSPKRDKKEPVLASANSFKKVLPKQCEILGLAVPGIVVTPMGSSSNRPVEMEYGESGFALLFPKINGVKIQKFHFSKDQKSRSFDENKLQEAGLKNNPDLRVVLIFGYNTWREGDTRFLNQVLIPLNEKNIIIAGGQVEYMAPFSPEMKSSGSVCIGAAGLTFSGPQIQAASVLLELDVDKEKTAESVIQRLKAAKIPEENSIGLMFACIGRGEQHYNKDNVEADLFRKHFPSVPLFGFFGNGEIGCDRVISGNFTLRECCDEHDMLLHGYTTVLTIIHFG
uniref:F-box protein 22 n=1 Tax=Leptobrachium leishanense TaxID=445787 RepID=A0A8C5ML66_9ANUR